MTGRADFTEQEWTLLNDAPFLSGFAVIYCEFSIISGLREWQTLAQQFCWAREQYPENELIQTLFEERPNDPNSPDNPAYHDRARDREEVLAECIHIIQQSTAIVDQKATPEEAQEYKALLFSIAEQVANAAGEGLLGSGQKVSRRELAVLTQIQTALGLTPCSPNPTSTQADDRC